MLAPDLHFARIQVPKGHTDHLPVLAEAVRTWLPHEAIGDRFAYLVQARIVESGVTLGDGWARLEQRTERVDVDVAAFFKVKGIIVVFFLGIGTVGFLNEKSRLITIVTGPRILTTTRKGFILSRTPLLVSVLTQGRLAGGRRARITFV